MTFFRWIILIVLILILCIVILGPGRITSIKYSIAERPDGGYLINAAVKKRYLFTADGIFPSDRRSFIVELIGGGKDFSYRNQKGFFYSFDEIKSIQKEWDFGYAWISEDRKYLYINLFWVKSPDGVTPADVNGRYQLKGSPIK